MNLTGSGGSGKSFVLDATKSFCKQFCRAIGKPFNDSVFIVTATTNTAAAQLKGIPFTPLQDYEESYQVF